MTVWLPHGLSEQTGDRCAHLASRISRISTIPERCPSRRRSGKCNTASLLARHNNGRPQQAISRRAFLPILRCAPSGPRLRLEEPAAASKSECGPAHSGCLRGCPRWKYTGWTLAFDGLFRPGLAWANRDGGVEFDGYPLRAYPLHCLHLGRL
jgi:hypothetical protein